MDRIKPIFAWIVGNRFWLTCGITAIVSVATWYVAWQALDAQRAEQVTKINGKKSSAESVLKAGASSGDEENPIDAHPNSGTKLEMDKRIKLAADAALAAWDVRYNQQKSILVFAEAIPPHIRTVLAQHQPMEKPFERELVEVTARNTFGEFFRRHMPGLVRNTINATWNYDEKGLEVVNKPSVTDPAKPEVLTQPKTEDLVYWREENQKLWHSKVTEFVGFDNNRGPDSVPNSEQMLALQQDVWILEAMLKIVGKVNDGYVANDLAPIKRLDHILVGKEAMSATPSSIEPLVYIPEGKVQAETSNKKQRGQKRTTTIDASLGDTKGTAFNPSESGSPFHGRYVDRNNTPLNKSEIDRILTDQKLSDRSYLAVAKRVPVRVAVKMDERRIADFLAEAANSPFTFEVRSLRINNKYIPNAGAKREGGKKIGANKDEPTLAGGPGSGTGVEMGDGGDQGGGGGGGKGEGKGAKDEDANPEVRRSFDVRVEFLGIVKIYNPPDRMLFYPEEKTENGEPDATAPTTTGAVPDTTAQK